MYSVAMGPSAARASALAEELLGAGFTNVRRYQLGLARVSCSETDLAGLGYVLRRPGAAPPFSLTSGRGRGVPSGGMVHATSLAV